MWLLMVFASVTVCAQKDQVVIDKIVAVVGSRIIMYSDVERQLLQAKEQGTAISDATRCEVLQQLLIENLLVHHAELDSVIVSDEEVEKELTNRMKYYISVFGSEEKFEEYYKKSISEFKADFKEDMKSMLVAQRMQQEIINKAKVTPQEVKEFFNSLPKDSIPYFNAEVELSRLTLSPEVSEVENEKVIQLLKDIKAKVLSGEKTFDELAKAFSEDPGSNQNGGYLGWTNRGDFVGAFEAAAYNLEKDQMSDIVKSEYGYHLIKLLERRGNRVNTQHILIKPKLSSEDIKKEEKYIDSLRMVILEGKMDFKSVVEKFSDNEAERKSGGIMLNPYTGNSIYETTQLEPDVYFAIDKLSPGDVSKPVLLTDQGGQRTLNIFQVISKTKPHVANIEEDYNKLSEAALSIRKQELLEKWIDTKIKKTYIRADEDFKTKCPSLIKWANGGLADLKVD